MYLPYLSMRKVSNKYLWVLENGERENNKKGVAMKRPGELTKKIVKGTMCEECGVDLAKHSIQVVCPVSGKPKRKKKLVVPLTSRRKTMG